AERDLPRYVLVSDFARFRLEDLDSGERHEFSLKDLSKNLRLFGFIAGYEARPVRAQDPINLRAAERMGKLHDRLKASGFEGHDLEVLLVRLLFSLFADDTGIFQPVQSFRDWIENRTSVDGSDLGAKLTQFFQVLNTPTEKRQRNLDEDLAAFPYVNGKLFGERLSIPEFDAGMRTDLLEAAALDWSRISPAIFGALFQSVMDPKARRNLGAHYTSEENILKVIEPLFLDDLRAELTAAKGNASKLFEFQKKLRTLTFLDPACGCGNFLVVAYRELRELELEILRQVEKNRSLDIFHAVQVNVDQFYGIEIEEFPAQIAQVALWLTDHQMNQKVSAEFGLYFARLPLVTSATIAHGNALHIDWEDVVPRWRVTHILGNPPFVGHHLQTAQQKADMRAALGDARAVGVLDYVTAWYAIAARFIQGTEIQVAFVSTNSITQGEQVGILWRALFKAGRPSIRFAHRTFRWRNEAKGEAAVYCVIIGFCNREPKARVIFDYESADAAPHRLPVEFINAYLVDAPWILLENRPSNPFGQPEMSYGSKPTDGGHFFLDAGEFRRMVEAQPRAAKLIRRFMGTQEFLYGEQRWVIWLPGVPPEDIRAVPDVLARVEAVSKFRAKSKAPSTRKYPHGTLFRQVTQPRGDYILI
ncbi:MAG: N-6 DNA methylase, partial [Thermoanaerobaculia bacterium]|nr:N-6 DNA methylase [Thermoanaerobaculia bacterium]